MRWCRVGLLILGLAFAAAGNPIASADPPQPPYRIVVIGDSITGGSNEGGFGPFGWPEIAWNGMRAQGIDVIPVVSGQGGSGYVQRGLAGTVFGEEASRLVTPDDSLIVFFGSRNDVDQPIEAISAAAHQAFTDARNVAPGAKLVVIGPIWPYPNPPGQIVAIRDALKREAAGAHAVWVDPIAEGWLTGPGLIGADGTHPNNDGHVEMAGRIEQIIKSALGLP